MSKASEWASRYRHADEAKNFEWQRIVELERDRPTFTLNEPCGAYLPPQVATIGDDEMLHLGDYAWIPRDRALALAHWILDTLEEDKPQ